MDHSAQNPAQEIPPAHGSALRYWFLRSGLSKTALARAVTALAVECGHHQIRPDASRVRRWINDGERPRDPVPGLLAQVLSDHIGHPVTTRDLGLGDAAPDNAQYRGPRELLDSFQSWIEVNSISQAHSTSSNIDLDADTTRLLTAMENWAYAASRPLPASSKSAVSLGGVDVDRLATFTATFREMDNRFGGASMLHSATAHLAANARLLREGTYRESIGRRLYAELADLAGVVGWAAHDAGNYPAAVRYLTLGVHAAREGHDRTLSAHLLQCLARIWGYLGHPARARDCIALALYGTHTTPNLVLRAGLHALDARFAALLGAEREAVRAVREAEEIFTGSDDADTPAYLSYLDHSELTSTLGEVMLFLARTTDRPTYGAAAVDLLSKAAGGRTEGKVRSQVFDAIGLARAHLVVGEIEGACHHGQRALRIGTGVTSARVRKRYHDLAHETRAQTDTRLVELRGRLMTAATGKLLYSP